MDQRFTPKVDQRAPVRPISFVLDNFGFLGDPVTLPIRPEDLTRNEPSRISVHQTLGRGVTGWVDNFGEGLPSVTISGTTGWRYQPALGLDGYGSFDALNTLVAHRYHEAKQDAIDTGRDPAGVKLLFVDLLDGFAWSVAPTQFVLRRSKSRPLLYQYNISLQAVSTSIDGGLQLFTPDFGGLSAGLRSLGGVIGDLARFRDTVAGLVNRAVSLVNGVTAPIGALARDFLTTTGQVFSLVSSTVGSVTGGFNSVANGLIGIASDLAQSGVNIFRTLSSIAGLPGSVQAALSAVGSAFNEAYCIFRNSLRPRAVYEQFEGIYGASNCSSTTGGRAPSIYSDRNTFSEIQPDRAAITPTGSGLSSLMSLKSVDTVLSPMPIDTMASHLGNVVAGVTV